MDPRTPITITQTTPADLAMLLAEADREDPDIATPLRDDVTVTRDADDIDERILAGLVTF
jgi:hypothetical protein